jgi:hypothetical protein
MAERYGEDEAQRKMDVDWIADVTADGLVVFSKDNALLTGDEGQAICDCRAKVFLLPERRMREHEQVARFVAHRYRIALRARKSGGFAYKVFPKELVLALDCRGVNQPEN